VKEVALRGVYQPPLNGTELTLRAGVYVVLGSEADGTSMLIGLLGGLWSPRRGSVRIDGADPCRTPAARRRIGLLLGEEALPPAASLGDAIDRALRLRAGTGSAEKVLDLLGLSAWKSRRVESLTAAERRSAALGLALSQPEPAGLFLHEPLATSPAVDRARVCQLVAEHAGGGSIVVCTTSSPRDAAALGGMVLLLDRGQLVRSAAAPLATELAPGTALDLWIRTSDPRRLATELAGAPAVSGVDWDDAATPGQLRVRGPDPQALALAVVRAAGAAKLSIEAIVPGLPGLALARAASDGIARAAYDAAQRAAYEAYRHNQGAGAPRSWADP